MVLCPTALTSYRYNVLVLPKLDLPFSYFKSRVDDKGRIKIGADFRGPMAVCANWFVCSLEGEVVRIYPAEEWQRIKLALQSEGGSGALVVAFAEKHGFETEVDGCSRILIPRPLFGTLLVSESVWLYWRDGHILVLNEKQHHQRQKSPEEIELRRAHLAPFAKMLDEMLEGDTEKAPRKETIH